MIWSADMRLDRDTRHLDKRDDECLPIDQLTNGNKWSSWMKDEWALPGKVPQIDF